MKPFFLACRPKTLIASISPICIGTALAIGQGVFRPFIFLLTLLTGLGLQITANLVNDLFDFLKGADTIHRKGPPRAIASGIMTIATMKKAILAVVFITIFCGSALALQGGIIISILLPLGILFAIGYTAGPLPLAYLGIAEFFVLVFFGPVATAMSYYMQTQELNPQSFAVGIAPGLLSCGILILNNLRDQKEDFRAKKKTLVVRFGNTFGKWEYTIAVGIAPLLSFCINENKPLVLLSTLCAIPAFLLIREVQRVDNPAKYAPIFPKTGKLLLYYTIINGISLTL